MGEVKTFNDVALYLKGEFMGNVHRIDCKEVTVTTGVKYAQHDDAVNVSFLRKGKRKRQGTLLTHKPWLRIIAAGAAVDTDPMLVPASHGGSGGRSRYLSCDPRWATDFEDRIAGMMGVLLEIGAGEREGEFLDRMKGVVP